MTFREMVNVFNAVLKVSLRSPSVDNAKALAEATATVAMWGNQNLDIIEQAVDAEHFQTFKKLLSWSAIMAFTAVQSEEEDMIAEAFDALAGVAGFVLNNADAIEAVIVRNH